jgi:hypothetical protein
MIMKTPLLILMMAFSTCCCLAQVGIGTTSPTAMLDVNGNMRIRTTSLNPNESSAKDSVLVVSADGTVGRVSAKSVVNSYLKTFIKGRFSSPTTQSISISSGSQKIIPFNLKEFDTNNDFNTATSTFTASQSGIYSIWVQIKGGGSVAVATEFGVAIAKNGTIVTRNSFANVGVDLGLLGVVNVSPPLRNTTALVQLNAGDTISFYVLSSLASVSLAGTGEDTYFTIEQVR